LSWVIFSFLLSRGVLILNYSDNILSVVEPKNLLLWSSNYIKKR
jgi:hypothetical protein